MSQSPEIAGGARFTFEDAPVAIYLGAPLGAAGRTSSNVRWRLPPTGFVQTALPLLIDTLRSARVLQRWKVQSGNGRLAWKDAPGRDFAIAALQLVASDAAHSDTNPMSLISAFEHARRPAEK
jgi:hypothetical protein